MASHTESIIQPGEKACYATGMTYQIERHHCFKSSRRKNSEKYGLWVWLNHDVHMKMHDHCQPYETLENDLKKVAQQAFEDNGGERDEFMRIFGCSYL